MANIEISGLPATPGLSLTDQFPSKKGTADYRATLEQLADLVKDDTTAAEILAKILTVDTDSSTLNANFLQGAARSFFTNASNLDSGTVPTARLPSQTITSTGGSNGINSPFAKAIPIPSFLFNGQRIMIQGGLTQYYPPNTSFTITYPTPFVGGFGYSNINDHSPLFLVSPYCITGDISPSPTESIEIGVSTTRTTLSYANCATYRRSGSSTDYAKAFWLAIGYY